MLAMGWCGVLAMVGAASRPSGEIYAQKVT
jgi:hypothetical protein